MNDLKIITSEPTYVPLDVKRIRVQPSDGQYEAGIERGNTGPLYIGRGKTPTEAELDAVMAIIDTSRRELNEGLVLRGYQNRIKDTIRVAQERITELRKTHPLNGERGN